MQAAATNEEESALGSEAHGEARTEEERTNSKFVLLSDDMPQKAVRRN